MPGYRNDRTNEDIRRELTAILRTVKDPRVTGLVSIVRVDVARDLGSAKVYVSSMDGLDAARQAVEGLTSAAGYMQRQLGQALRLRCVPQLRFVADDSIEHSAEIARTLAQLKKEREARGEDAQEPER